MVTMGKTELSVDSLISIPFYLTNREKKKIINASRKANGKNSDKYIGKICKILGNANKRENWSNLKFDGKAFRDEFTNFIKSLCGSIISRDEAIYVIERFNAYADNPTEKNIREFKKALIENVERNLNKRVKLTYPFDSQAPFNVEYLNRYMLLAENAIKDKLKESWANIIKIYISIFEDEPERIESYFNELFDSGVYNKNFWSYIYGTIVGKLKKSNEEQHHKENDETYGALAFAFDCLKDLDDYFNNEFKNDIAFIKSINTFHLILGDKNRVETVLFPISPNVLSAYRMILSNAVVQYSEFLRLTDGNRVLEVTKIGQIQDKRDDELVRLTDRVNHLNKLLITSCLIHLYHCGLITIDERFELVERFIDDPSKLADFIKEVIDRAKAKYSNQKDTQTFDNIYELFKDGMSPYEIVEQIDATVKSKGDINNSYAGTVYTTKYEYVKKMYENIICFPGFLKQDEQIEANSILEGLSKDEDGYQILDKIISDAFKRLGYREEPIIKGLNSSEGQLIVVSEMSANPGLPHILSSLFKKIQGIDKRSKILEEALIYILSSRIIMNAPLAGNMEARLDNVFLALNALKSMLTNDENLIISSNLLDSDIIDDEEFERRITSLKGINSAADLNSDRAHIKMIKATFAAYNPDYFNSQDLCAHIDLFSDDNSVKDNEDLCRSTINSYLQIVFNSYEKLFFLIPSVAFVGVNRNINPEYRETIDIVNKLLLQMMSTQNCLSEENIEFSLKNTIGLIIDKLTFELEEETNETAKMVIEEITKIFCAFIKEKDLCEIMDDEMKVKFGALDNKYSNNMGNAMFLSTVNGAN